MLIGRLAALSREERILLVVAHAPRGLARCSRGAPVVRLLRVLPGMGAVGAVRLVWDLLKIKAGVAPALFFAVER